ncbi:ATP-binding cassette domain-containing protein [Janibacter sp. GXQ6167]|uniref:ATP-binding cassette domain-containing protein n=1 Tax=Janibacter sp. GXQ6167 TaxID=3240791 RepID=UPI003523A992
MTPFRMIGLLGSHRFVLPALVTLGLTVTSTYVAQALLLSRIFGSVVSDGAVRWSIVGPAMAGLAAALLIRPALVLARELASTALMTAVKTDLRSRLIGDVVEERAADVRGRLGRDHALVVDGVENLDPYLGKYLPQVAMVVIACTGIGIAMVVIDPVVGAIALAAVLVLPLAPRAWDRILARKGADHWEAYEGLHAEFLDSMTGMTTLVLHGAEARRQRELQERSASLLSATMGQLKVSLIESGLSAFALVAVPALVLAAAWGRREHLSATAVFALILLSVELVRPLRDLATHWHAGYAGTYAGREILAVLQPHEHDREVDGLDQDQDGLSLSGATFTYPGADRPVLHSVTATWGRGLHVISGASGSGKSSMAAILAGLAEPEQGVVRLDGRALGREARRGEVALVAQDPVLFAGTVGDNIALARPATGQPRPIDEVAAVVGIGSDDPELTLDTVVGERGGLLSGGQRQRVALARALRLDRRVLILDEADSALDRRSEEAILARLATDQSDRIVLMVTHRPRPTGDAVSTTVLDAGQIARPVVTR